jgi:hypothetical protein
METPEHQRIRPPTECPDAPEQRRRVRRAIFARQPIEVFFIETTMTEDGHVQTRSGTRHVEDEELYEKGFAVKTYHSSRFQQIILIKKN